MGSPVQQPMSEQRLQELLAMANAASAQNGPAPAPTPSPTPAPQVQPAAQPGMIAGLLSKLFGGFMSGTSARDLANNSQAGGALTPEELARRRQLGQ